MFPVFFLFSRSLTEIIVGIYWVDLCVFILKVQDMLKWSILNKPLLETPTAFYLFPWIEFIGSQQGQWPSGRQMFPALALVWFFALLSPLGLSLYGDCTQKPFAYHVVDKNAVAWSKKERDVPAQRSRDGERTQKGLAYRVRRIGKKAFSPDNGPQGSWELLFTDPRLWRVERLNVASHIKYVISEMGSNWLPVRAMKQILQGTRGPFGFPFLVLW